jgi:stage II sporulation protein M
VSVWLGYDWIMDNVPSALGNAMPEEVDRLSRRLQDFPDMRTFRESISAPFLFLNNTRAVFVIFLAGLVSFSVLGVLLYMINISLIGGLYGLLELLGIEALPLFLAGVLPHGILEIPALMIGSASMLYFGVSIVTPQIGRSMGEVIIELFADWMKIFIGIVVPLLAVAAVIETYLTPAILHNVMKLAG